MAGRIILLLFSLVFGIDSLSVTTESGNDCPSEWFDFGELGCFHFGREASPMSYSEAFYYCDQLGGALAEPTNNLRQAVLAGLASDLAIDPDLDHWWIGAREVAEADWRWDSSASWDYTDWSLAEPNDGVNQNCVLLSSHHGYKWVDELCGGNANYPARPSCQMY